MDTLTKDEVITLYKHGVSGHLVRYIAAEKVRMVINKHFWEQHAEDNGPHLVPERHEFVGSCEQLLTTREKVMLLMEACCDYLAMTEGVYDD